MQLLIYNKIIHDKTASGSREDKIRRILQYGSIEAPIYDIFNLDDLEYSTEALIEKNENDIREVYQVIKAFVSIQKSTYDFFEIDVIEDILCPTYELTKEEILFIVNTEPFETIN
ncbi:hypothetical protein ACWOCD_00175 [Enterococcus silesiacus]|nr:hypothetical protein [Enterococcus silesiacus]